MAIKASNGLGERVAKYRRLSGLSAQRVADRAGFGLTRGVIANIESGRKKDITVDQLLALSAALGVPPAALALPLEQPLQMVHLYGDEQVRPMYFRASELLDWFTGERNSKVLPDSEVGDTRLAFALMNAVSIFERYRSLFLKPTDTSTDSTLPDDQHRATQAFHQDYEEAKQRLRDLGADISPPKRHD